MKDIRVLRALTPRQSPDTNSREEERDTARKKPPRPPTDGIDQDTPDHQAQGKSEGLAEPQARESDIATSSWRQKLRHDGDGRGQVHRETYALQCSENHQLLPGSSHALADHQCAAGKGADEFDPSWTNRVCQGAGQQERRGGREAGHR